MLNDYSDILTVEDVQDILGIGKNAVYQLCREHSRMFQDKQKMDHTKNFSM